MNKPGLNFSGENNKAPMFNYCSSLSSLDLPTSHWFDYNLPFNWVILASDWRICVSSWQLHFFLISLLWKQLEIYRASHSFSWQESFYYASEQGFVCNVRDWEEKIFFCCAIQRRSFTNRRLDYIYGWILSKKHRSIAWQNVELWIERALCYDPRNRQTKRRGKILQGDAL